MEVYIINSIAKSYILNIKIRPLVTEYALRINLVGGNTYAYFGHLWSYFDIQNLRLVILYRFEPRCENDFVYCKANCFLDVPLQIFCFCIIHQFKMASFGGGNF